MGPIFITEPVSTIYDVSSTLTTVNFVCEVAANPFPSYLWYVTHDQVQKPVNLTDQSKTVTNGRLSMQSPSQTKDNGDYQCLAQNSFGAVRSDFATLSFGCKHFVCALIHVAMKIVELFIYFYLLFELCLRI